MRATVLVLALLVVAGCRGTREEEPPRKKRDYYSINRSSTRFLWETGRVFREAKRRARAARDPLGERIARRRQLNRSERSFFWSSFVRKGVVRSTADLWNGLGEHLADEFRDNAEQMRFGFLDSGD